MSKKDASQKLFTVQFLAEDGTSKTTKVPAKKGKSLKDVIEPILLNYDLSFETHAIFLESSGTPLPLTNDTFPYGGHTLHIKAINDITIDKRIVTMMRSDSKKGQIDARKRFSDLLLHYETHGFDGLDKTDSATPQLETEDEFYLESSWKDIITETEDIVDKQRVQQEAIWELFSSEINYLRDLKIIIQVFRKCFVKIKEDGYFAEVDERLVFANIDEIYDVNCTFWRLLNEVVINLRKTKKPINPKELVKAFNMFEDLFQPYITFCNADTSNMKLPNYDDNTNDMLNKFITWCDNHEQCKRIKLQGFLIKPLQRVTKYSLLLRAILSKTEDEEERKILSEIMSRVETFVSKINKAVHMRQEQEKLLSTLSKFELYKPCEGFNDEAEKIMSEYCSLDLKTNIPEVDDLSPRFILKEGPMKLLEKQGKKDVHAFLFSDVIIIAKLKRNIDKFRIIRQPFRLNKVIIRPLKDAGSHLFIYLNEYGVLANSFVLQINPTEQAQWLNMIEKTKAAYEIQREENLIREDLYDEDLPLSNMSKNKNRKRQRSIQATQNLLGKQPVNFEAPIEWTNTRIIICVTLFAIFNIVVTKVFGISR